MIDLRKKTYNTVTSYNSDSLDEFGNLPVAFKQTLFDAQFTYDLQPLLYAQMINGVGTATITHDTTNRRAVMALASAAVGSYAYMQSWEHFRYQPGKEQGQTFTANFGAAATNALCWGGYYDKYNDVGFRLIQDTDGLIKFQIRSNTSVGDQSKDEADWNGDLVASGKTLDPSKDIIYKITFQALYVGDVTLWIQIEDKFIRAHTFYNSGVWAYPYIETANLPISFGVEAVGGTATKTMTFNCTAVSSSGGQDETVGYEFFTPDLTASASTLTHAITIRPKTTFNGIQNRSKLSLLELDFLVTGNASITYEVRLNQVFTSAPSYTDFNTTYSSWEYGTGGTANLLDAGFIRIGGGYVPATTQNKGVVNEQNISRYPITLDVSGANRGLGEITVLITSVGGSSATRFRAKIKEIR